MQQSSPFFANGTPVLRDAELRRPAIATAVVQNLLGGEQSMLGSPPELVAHALLSREAASCTGNTYICEDLLAGEGIIDPHPYSFAAGSTSFLPDFLRTTTTSARWQSERRRERGRRAQGSGRRTR